MPKFDVETALAWGLSSLVFLLASLAQAVTIVPGDLIINKDGGIVVHLDGSTLAQTTLYTNSLASGSPIVVKDDGGFVVDLNDGIGHQFMHVDALTQVENLLAALFYVVPHSLAVDRSPEGFKNDDEEDLLIAIGQLGGTLQDIYRVKAPMNLSLVSSGPLDETEGSGVAVEADGQIVTAGISAFCGTCPEVHRIDPDSGTPSTIHTGSPLIQPLSIDVEADGQLIVADSSAGIIRVDPNLGGADTTLLPHGFYKEAIVDRLNGNLILNSFVDVKRYDPVSASSTTLLSGIDFSRRIALVQPWLLIVDPADDPVGINLNGNPGEVGTLNVTFDAATTGAFNSRFEEVSFAGVNQFIASTKLARPGFAIPGNKWQVWVVEYTGTVNGQSTFVITYDDADLGTFMEEDLIVFQYFPDLSWQNINASATWDYPNNTVTVVVNEIESVALGVAGACNNGIDDDGDSNIDFGDDPGCESPTDISEHAPTLPCDDGIDNDGDRRMDFDPVTFADPTTGVGDPGCFAAGTFPEQTQCQDGIENQPGNPDGIDFDGGASLDFDGDGMMDTCRNGPPCGPVTTPDLHCLPGGSQNAWRGCENPKCCGLGFELALALPLLGLWRRRRITNTQGGFRAEV